ncbi:MAG: hypothetical protein U5J97_03400 [Trueperaceae bacterium]|nr:hypothetical protein [Trueperaceae bacterium]
MTVTFLSIEVGRGDTNGTADGDPAGDAGDFDFELGTVKPDPETGLLSKRFFVSPRIIVSHVEDVIAAGGTPFLRFCQERIQSLCIWEEDFQPGTYIQVNSEHANELGLTPFQDRFAVPFTSQFAVWGEIQEIDDPFPSSGSTIDHGFSFGGLGDDVATFEGDSLTKGTKVKVFTQADDQESYRLDVTVQVTIE